MRGLAIAAVAAQAGIAVTGSVVRVTGSGLGCPTWPECFPGSLVPTPHPGVAALTQWIEFGNRLLTGVVVLVAGLCFLAAVNTRPRRARLTRLALVQPVGVVVQAVLGGMTVLLGLVWWSVAVHFTASMIMVWLAVQLVTAATEGDGPPRPVVGSAVRGLVTLSAVVLGALLVAGTLVTAAGPHAGDAATPRLDVGVPVVAQLHADLLFGYLGLLVGLGFALAAVHAPALLWRRFRLLLVVVLAQGVLGGVQYALGVPEVLVSLHVLGAALVTVAAAALWAATVRRPPLVGTTEAIAPGAAGLSRTGA
ncbi:MAG TPA: COX15/CtaA family protein [Pseudonocardia sp.]|nr:COX15/CtaA family protein [Pseudonocardia sp.]